MCRVHTQKTPGLRHPWKDSTQEMGVETLELGCFAQRTRAEEPRQGEPAGRGASAETRTGTEKRRSEQASARPDAG